MSGFCVVELLLYLGRKDYLLVRVSHRGPQAEAGAPGKGGTQTVAYLGGDHCATAPWIFLNITMFLEQKFDKTETGSK